MKRVTVVNFRVTDEEKACFEAVAQALDLPVSAMVRTLVKREASRLGLKEKGKG